MVNNGRIPPSQVEKEASMKARARYLVALLLQVLANLVMAYLVLTIAFSSNEELVHAFSLGLSSIMLGIWAGSAGYLSRVRGEYLGHLLREKVETELMPAVLWVGVLSIITTLFLVPGSPWFGTARWVAFGWAIIFYMIWTHCSTGELVHYYKAMSSPRSEDGTLSEERYGTGGQSL
jgi:hypothetical protein